MDNSIFRKKSLDNMKSPDNLNEYIKVINPSIWIVFVAAFLLLVGAFVWGTMGTIEDKLPVTVVVSDSSASCNFQQSIESGMSVVISGCQGTVSSVSPFEVKLSFDTYIPDGTYEGYIVVGEISPISFIFN